MNGLLLDSLRPTLEHRHGRPLPEPNSDGWIGPLRSPLREDRNPSFSVRIDSEDGGRWKDHATEESGSLLDLCKRLNVDPPPMPGREARRKVLKADASTAWASDCDRRGLDRERLEQDWQCRPVVWSNRPAVRFPTAIGVDRIKYLDGGKSKNAWARRGGGAHWFGLPAARKALADGAPLYIANGEPSVWSCAQSGVAAVCNCAGEGTTPGADMLADLVALDVPIRVVLDLDDAGRKGARKLVAALRDAGARDAIALDLPPDLGSGGDVDDLHRRTGDAGLAGALAALPELQSEQETAEDEHLEQGDDCLAALRALPDNPDDCEQALRSFAAGMTDLDPIACESKREQAIKILKEKGCQAPGRMVNAAMPKGAKNDDDNAQGEALDFSEPEPWPDVVDGAVLLDDIAKAIRRFVVLPDEAAKAIALWIVFAWAHDAFCISPLLLVTSPEKRCGKTTLLSVLNGIAPRPLQTSNATVAAIFRVIGVNSPTLLIDEADTFLRQNDEMRGVLNGGHVRSSAAVLRTSGDDHEPRRFPVWCPKAIAMIGEASGRLGTLEDRAVQIRLKRRMPDETVDRLRLDRTTGLEPLRRRAARWAKDNVSELREVDPDVPDLGSDRAADNWRELLAVADVAGGDWPAQAREAAEILCGEVTSADRESAGEMLLRDLQTLFEEKSTDRIESSQIVEALAKMEDRPWPEWRKGKPITTRGVARLLRPFGVEPKVLRVSSTNTARGYDLEDFGDTFSRYLGAPSVTGVTELKSRRNRRNLSVTAAPDVTDRNSEKPSQCELVTDVTDRAGGTAGEVEL